MDQRYRHRWHNPVDLDELDHLVAIEPLPSYVWYEDMVDFVEGISDERAGRRLGRAIQGKGAFRRFRDELHEEYPELLQVWYAFRTYPDHVKIQKLPGCLA
jgi:hypothetical protein